MEMLVLDGESHLVEVTRYDVSGYTLRAGAPVATGRRVELVVADNPPVPCVVESVDGESIRLRRGWGR